MIAISVLSLRPLLENRVYTISFTPSAIIVPLSLPIYSNSRITEAKETLRAETAKLGTELRSEMKQLRADMNAEMAQLRIEMAQMRTEMVQLRADMNAGFERIEHALKIHELEHHRG